MQAPVQHRPTLLYVEDERAAAEIAIEVLGEHYDIDHCLRGDSALEHALRRRYDVMVIDRRLPGLSGTELVAAIRTARITTPILLLTALGAVDDRVEGLDSGANDYLVKPFDFRELLARLRALQRGYEAVGQRREIGSWLYVPGVQALYSPTGLRVGLTRTESELVDLLTSSPDHVFSRSEILNSVFSGGESVGTVEAYVHYVRRKSTPELIETVRGRGYRIGDPT